MTPSGDGLRQLTPEREGAVDWAPAWPPDGRQLCFASRGNTYSRLWLINADGSGLQALTTGEADDDFPAWSPDGRTVVFSRANRPGPDAQWFGAICRARAVLPEDPIGAPRHRAVEANSPP
jgi:Tol biopolymer transport system component